MSPQHRVQRLSLSYSAGETIEDDACILTGILDMALHDTHDGLIGYEVSLADEPLHLLPQGSTLLDLCTQEIPRGDVIEIVVLLDVCTLSTFAGAGSPEYDDIQHDIIY